MIIVCWLFPVCDYIWKLYYSHTSSPHTCIIWNNEHIRINHYIPKIDIISLKDLFYDEAKLQNYKPFLRDLHPKRIKFGLKINFYWFIGTKNHTMNLYFYILFTDGIEIMSNKNNNKHIRNSFLKMSKIIQRRIISAILLSPTSTGKKHGLFLLSSVS